MLEKNLSALKRNTSITPSDYSCLPSKIQGWGRWLLFSEELGSEEGPEIGLLERRNVDRGSHSNGLVSSLGMYGEKKSNHGGS